MAKPTWIGGATAVTQVTTVVVGSTTSGDTVAIKIGSNVIATATTSASGSTSTTIADLVSDWAIDTGAGQNITPAAATAANMTLTAKTKGVPFTVTTSTTGGATATLTSTTPSAGPGDYAIASNWFGDLKPASSADDVLITGDDSIVYNLDQSALTVRSIRLGPTFSGNLGTIDEFFQINVTAASISGEKFVSQSTGNVYINFGVKDVSPVIENTGTVTAGEYSFHLKGTNIATVTFRKGTLRINEAAVVDRVNQQYSTNKSADTTLEIANEARITSTLNKTGGKAYYYKTTTVDTPAIVNTGGDLHLHGNQNVGAVLCGGGTIYHYNTGTTSTTALTVEASGTIDFTKTEEAIKFAAPTIRGTGKINYNPGSVTFAGVPVSNGQITIEAV